MSDYQSLGGPCAAPLAVAARLRDRVLGFLAPRPPTCVLLLAPCRSIHTFGMAHCLDVAFVDAEGKVLKAVRNVPPMRMMRCVGAVGVMERRADLASPWFQTGEGVELCIKQRW